MIRKWRRLQDQQPDFLLLLLHFLEYAKEPHALGSLRCVLGVVLGSLLLEQRTTCVLCLTFLTVP